ncbi:MAG: 16S rRNA (cytidine1402-2'-O)-methyltransferase [Candidatus Endobugula sp.]|jgi:16S rRNA (cytidine1402-2'-O)-methyltransferase
MYDSNLGVLYVVATPIGNLSDMVPRAIETLQKVDVIAAEDTRHSAKLLQYFGISTKVMAYHDHSNEHRLQALIDILLSGQSIALISDAGTPLISDPGYKLVNVAREHSVRVVPIPGACALVAALSVSGLPSNQFVFEGFLPAKSSSRCKILESMRREHRTAIFYESPHRIVDSLKDFQSVLGGDRCLVIARELTKTFETVLSGTITDVIEQVREDANQQRGEFVVLLKGCEQKAENATITEDAERLMRILLEYVPIKIASAIAAKVTGIKKRQLYQWALGLK